MQRKREATGAVPAAEDEPTVPLLRDPRKLERALGVVLWAALFAVLLSIVR